MRRFLLPAALAVAALLGGCATVSLEDPSCPSDAAVDGLVSRYLARQPAPNPPDKITAFGAACGRDKFTARLAEHYGRVVGYKAGLTNTAVQQRFGHPSPVRGTLFEKMILRDGAVVQAQYGARPVFEADLVVEVASSAVHEAKTPMDVLANLRNLYPFIELPDLVFEDPGRIDGNVLTYVNVGARLGVLGSPIPARADPALLSALGDMTVRLLDPQGNLLDEGKGTAILNHPLNAVIWLARDLRRSGITLQPGDLLSLGSFTRLLPVKAGSGARAVYEGLPGNPGVSVSFR
jgi:2-keto-4-pentenoate hydratase